MKPTIPNAFFCDGPLAREALSRSTSGNMNAWEALAGMNAARAPNSRNRPDARRSHAASLVPMQADLRESAFGWSLELSPIQAVDAVHGLSPCWANYAALQFIVSMEQSAWRGPGNADLSVNAIAQRLALSVIEKVSDDQLILDEVALQQLVSLCQPTRLLVIAVAGVIEPRDAQAINHGVETGVSPLNAEMRAVSALEVLGDRSVVLHSREKTQPVALIAQNFRHYLSAVRARPVDRLATPEPHQIERLIGLSGILTIRPIETQVFSGSIDVGVNTSPERFAQPADRALIYDIPSNTWHDEP